MEPETYSAYYDTTHDWYLNLINDEEVFLTKIIMGPLMWVNCV